MNDSTLIVVHAYQGDAHQVQNALPQYVHHECPVLVLSPADSPVEIEGVECRSAGLRAYTGQTSLDRQRAHLELLLNRPQEFFLLHDSDSVCLSPGLPSYLYANPDTVFYNATPTERFLDGRDPGFDMAEVFQPPLFFSRASLVRMLEVSDRAMNMLAEWSRLIDWYFALMAREAGLNAKPLPDGISRPIWAPYEVARVYAMVRMRGFVFLHSVKTKEVLDVLITGHAEFDADPQGATLCEPW